jgi:hypothetical protein
VREILRISSETRSEKCLGLPVPVGKSRTSVFAYLKERIWQKIQGWKEKLLSKAGKEIMIKAVAQAIPVFAMGCFDITKEMCNQISTMIAKYWWNNQDKENSIHWVSWERLVASKSDGGLGFRDLHSFNMAMLAKQSWRLIQKPDSLCAQILKATYFPDTHLLKAKVRDGCSYTWRSIMQGVQVLKEGVIWRIGSGLNVDIWADPWHPRDHTRGPITPRGRNIISRVHELINPVTERWDAELIEQIFCEEDARLRPKYYEGF